jgi:DNA-binding NarL/FixJ family response regulator
MKTINIAIIEKAPLARGVLEETLLKANFNIVASTESISYFLDQAKEGLINIPDICLLDAAVKISSIKSIRKYYPETKIVVYDPIATRPKGHTLRTEHFDAYMSKSLKLQQWIPVLQSIINHQE